MNKLFEVVAVTLFVSSLLPCAYASGSCEAGRCEVPNLTVQEQKLIEREAQDLWQAIRWTPNAESALATARQQNKPILVVLEVGQKGKANAPET